MREADMPLPTPPLFFPRDMVGLQQLTCCDMQCSQCGGSGFYTCTWCGGDKKSMNARFVRELVKLR